MECLTCGGTSFHQDVLSSLYSCRRCGTVCSSLTQTFGEIDIGDVGENLRGTKQQVATVRIKKDALRKKEAALTQQERQMRDLLREAGDHETHEEAFIPGGDSNEKNGQTDPKKSILVLMKAILQVQVERLGKEKEVRKLLGKEGLMLVGKLWAAFVRCCCYEAIAGSGEQAIVGGATSSRCRAGGGAEEAASGSTGPNSLTTENRPTQRQRGRDRDAEEQLAAEKAAQPVLHANADLLFDTHYLPGEAGWRREIYAAAGKKKGTSKKAKTTNASGEILNGESSRASASYYEAEEHQDGIESDSEDRDADSDDQLLALEDEDETAAKRRKRESAVLSATAGSKNVGGKKSEKPTQAAIDEDIFGIVAVSQGSTKAAKKKRARGAPDNAQKFYEKGKNTRGAHAAHCVAGIHWFWTLDLALILLAGVLAKKPVVVADAYEWIRRGWLPFFNLRDVLSAAAGKEEEVLVGRTTTKKNENEPHSALKQLVPPNVSEFLNLRVQLKNYAVGPQFLDVPRFPGQRDVENMMLRLGNLLQSRFEGLKGLSWSTDLTGLSAYPMVPAIERLAKLFAVEGQSGDEGEATTPIDTTIVPRTARTLFNDWLRDRDEMRADSEETCDHYVAERDSETGLVKLRRPNWNSSDAAYENLLAKKDTAATPSASSGKGSGDYAAKERQQLLASDAVATAPFLADGHPAPRYAAAFVLLALKLKTEFNDQRNASRILHHPQFGAGGNSAALAFQPAARYLRWHTISGRKRARTDYRAQVTEPLPGTDGKIWRTPVYWNQCIQKQGEGGSYLSRMRGLTGSRLPEAKHMLHSGRMDFGRFSSFTSGSAYAGKKAWLEYLQAQWCPKGDVDEVFGWRRGYQEIGTRLLELAQLGEAERAGGRREEEENAGSDSEASAGATSGGASSRKRKTRSVNVKEPPNRLTLLGKQQAPGDSRKSHAQKTRFFRCPDPDAIDYAGGMDHFSLFVRMPQTFVFLTSILAIQVGCTEYELYLVLLKLERWFLEKYSTGVAEGVVHSVERGAAAVGNSAAVSAVSGKKGATTGSEPAAPASGAGAAAAPAPAAATNSRKENPPVVQSRQGTDIPPCSPRLPAALLEAEKLLEGYELPQKGKKTLRKAAAKKPAGKAAASKRAKAEGAGNKRPKAKAKRKAGKKHVAIEENKLELVDDGIARDSSSAPSKGAGDDIFDDSQQE
eukprot:g7713.t1